MKSQRSFVVERKSSRRRQKAQASSIWGDTDFKALARDAEVHAPHVFEEQQQSAAASETAPIMDKQAADTLEPSDRAQPVETSPTDKPVGATPPALMTQKRRSSRQRATTEQPSRPHRKAAPQLVEVPVAAVMTFGALMKLEGENRTLAARWREKLEAERAQLVRMLERLERRNITG
ncbi:MAG: hypothetical protein WA950_04975 [Shinella sp.]|uniref:hypothetical protein n=1 Tax=Shinella sp. TaxID=1870904 RepID=UPI003C73FB0C